MGKNQHFIPRFYQKYWECERRGYLWEFDLMHSTYGPHQKSIRKNCNGDYIYEGDTNNPNNAFEHWYELFENSIAPDYANLINSRYCFRVLTANQKELICRLFSHISARSYTNVYENVDNHILALHFTLGIKNKTIDRRNILNMIALANGGTLEGTTSSFADELMNYRIQILVSDKPNIIFCNNIIQQVHVADEFFFPLCPYMVAFFTKSPSAIDGEIRKIKEEEYSRFIELYANSYYVSSLYASNKEVLDLISKKFFFCSFSIPNPTHALISSLISNKSPT